MPRAQKSSKQKQADYDRFYDRAFAEMDIDEKIIEKGGGQSFEKFKSVSKEVMTNNRKRDYWDKMFDRTFVSRKGTTERSQYQRLGDAIYHQHFEGKVSKNVVEKVGKGGKVFFYVAKGFSPRQYGDGRTLRPGQRLAGKTIDEALSDFDLKFGGTDPRATKRRKKR